MEQWSKYVSVEMNACNNIRAVFSMQSVPRGYKKDKDCSCQLTFEMPAYKDMSLGAEELN
jgi:hypothetical protein